MWIVKKSKVHGQSVFCRKHILKNVRIIEYTEKITNRIYNIKRCPKYSNSKQRFSIYIYLNKG